MLVKNFKQSMMLEGAGNRFHFHVFPPVSVWDSPRKGSIKPQARESATHGVGCSIQVKGDLQECGGKRADVTCQCSHPHHEISFGEEGIE